MKSTIKFWFRVIVPTSVIFVTSCATTPDRNDPNTQKAPSANSSVTVAASTATQVENVDSFDAAKVSLEIIKDYAPVVSGSPEIVVNTPITSGQFLDFGLDSPTSEIKYPPMTFILLRGDFDTSKLGGENKVSFTRANYVGMLFNSETGFLRKVAVSVDGAKFAKLLATIKSDK